MTNLIKANFNGNQVLFQNNAYLNATTIAKAFGKQPKDYLRNERTGDYIKALINRLNSNRRNRLFEENQIVIKKGGSSTNGGGTWLHPKLAIDFARWLSAEFAVWCDEQIEKILYSGFAEQPKLDDLSTVESREPLKDAVNTMVHKCHLSYSDCWRMVHQRFKVGHVNQLTDNQVTEAITYVHDRIIEGEVMPRKKGNSDHHIAGLALMMKATRVKEIQDRKLREAEIFINQACLAIRDAQKCSGAIYDGVSEARLYLDATPEESRAAKVRANNFFKDWKTSRCFD